MNLITIDSSESWFVRNSNPSIILKKDGVEFVEDHILTIEECWHSLLDDS